MSDHSPGSTDWWIETALITAGGLGLAWVLWDGPVFQRAQIGPGEQPALSTLSPRTVSALIEQGCVTSEHLRALREGREMPITCPDPQPTVILRDLPPEDRPFP